MRCRHNGTLLTTSFLILWHFQKKLSSSCSLTAIVTDMYWQEADGTRWALYSLIPNLKIRVFFPEIITHRPVVACTGSFCPNVPVHLFPSKVKEKKCSNQMFLYELSYNPLSFFFNHLFLSAGGASWILFHPPPPKDEAELKTIQVERSSAAEWRRHRGDETTARLLSSCLTITCSCWTFAIPGWKHKQLHRSPAPPLPSNPLNTSTLQHPGAQ